MSDDPCYNCNSEPAYDGKIGCYACWPEVIKQQQAEIERLREENATLCRVAARSCQINNQPKGSDVCQPDQ